MFYFIILIIFGEVTSANNISEVHTKQITDPLDALMPNGTENTVENLETVRQILKSFNEKHAVLNRQPVNLKNDQFIKVLLNRLSFLGGPLRHLDDISWRNARLREYLFEGDVLLLPEQARQIAELEEPTGRSRRQTNNKTTNIMSLWDKNQTIYYSIDGLSPYAVHIIRQSVSFWQNNTCLKIEENAVSTNRIRFVYSSGCWSYVGRQTKWKTQEISIGKGCDTMSTVTHEVAHALGFFHTQARPDRDTYVVVNQKNIIRKNIGNFAKVRDLLGTSELVGYDFGSVLQYSPYAFALNPRKPTVFARNWRFQSTMGRKEEPSFADVKAMNIAYKCQDSCPDRDCENAGFVDSNNCSRCVCPPVFSGIRCEIIKTGDLPVCNGKILKVRQDWSSFRGEFGFNSSDSKEITGKQKDCVWHLQAPLGYQVYLRLNVVNSDFCYEGCYTHAVEINSGDFDLTGMRIGKDINPGANQSYSEKCVGPVRLNNKQKKFNIS